MNYIKRMCITILLQSLTTQVLIAQFSNSTQKDFSALIGFQIHTSELDTNPNYFSADPNNVNADLDIYLGLKFSRSILKDRRFKLTSGLAIGRGYSSIAPEQTLNNQLTSFPDTALVHEVAIWDLHLQIPIGFTFEVPRLINGHGLKLYLEVQNRIQIKRTGIDNVVLESWDKNTGYGSELYVEQINAEVNNYYSDYFSKYIANLNLGVGIIMPDRGILGMSINTYLNSRYNQGQKSTENFGFNCFIEYPLFNIQ